MGVRARVGSTDLGWGPAVETVGEPAPVPGTARGGVFDVNAGERRGWRCVVARHGCADGRAAARRGRHATDLGPRPVPRPTYAMRATATWMPVEERAQEPVRPTRSRLTPVIADLDDDIPESFPVARRSAVG